MTEPLASNEQDVQKRRSTRIEQAVPITVTGVDALGQPFKERTTTVQVNCHGCKYQSKHYVPKNSVISLEIPRQEASLPPRSVTGRVVWVQRPRTVRELFQIGMEFDIAGNVWGIGFPPEDWFPYPDKEKPGQGGQPAQAAQPASQTAPPREMTVEFELALPTSETPAVVEAPPPTKPADRPVAPGAPAAASKPTAPATEHKAPSAPAPSESKIHLVAPPEAVIAEMQATVTREVSRMLDEAKATIGKTARKDAQAAITEEMAIVRQQLDALLHEAVEHAVKTSLERVSETTSKKLVQQVSDRTAGMIEEVRRTNEASAALVEGKVREAVEKAVNAAVEQAAQHAAQRAAEQNVHGVVESTVKRVIAEHEAASPSLKILTSAEAAQRHLNQWRQNLEETAQSVRVHTIEQAQADALSANQRLRSELESAVAGATNQIRERITESSQEAWRETRATINAEMTRVRLSLDEAIADSHAKIQNLGAGIEEQRARAEEARAEAAAAAERIKTEHEAIAAGSSEQLRQRIIDASQAVLSQIESEVASKAAQLRSSIEHSLDSARAAAQATSTELQQQIGRTEEARHQAAAAGERLKAEAESTLSTSAARLRADVTDISQSAVEQTERDLAAKAGLFHSALDEKVATSQASVQAALKQLEEERARASEANAAISESIKLAIERSRNSVDEMMRAQTVEINRQADAAIAERTQRIAPLLDQAAKAAVDKFSAQLDQEFAPKLGEAQKVSAELAQYEQRAVTIRGEVQSQIDSVSSNIEASLAQGEQRAEEIRARIKSQVEGASSSLEDKVAQAEQRAVLIRAQIQTQVDGASAIIEAELAKARQHASGICAQIDSQLGSASSSIEAKLAQVEHRTREADTQIQSTLDGVSSKIAEKLAQADARASQIRSEIESQLSDVAQTIQADLAQAEQIAEHIRSEVQAQVTNLAARVEQVPEQVSTKVQAASEKAIAESMARLQTEIAKVPAEIETLSESAFAKVEAEIDKRSTEVQHETYEALSKAAAWYQTKAQTTMQASMERTVEQAATGLRDRAAEVSSLVASELDHHRRTYAAHSQAEMEEAAKEIVNREKARLGESAAIANANLTNQIQEMAIESLRRFQEAARQASEKTQSDMEFNREGALGDFQKSLDRKMAEGVEQARTFLESQLAPLIEAWETKRHRQQQEWIDLLKASTQESIEQYKARLDNASNSWLLASATMLGQSSQAVLDTLARSAEKRLRETCAQVLSGMGDTIKERLIEISGSLGAEQNDNPEGPKR